jgi:hypothetical protein
MPNQYIIATEFVAKERGAKRALRRTTTQNYLLVESPGLMFFETNQSPTPHPEEFLHH